VLGIIEGAGLPSEDLGLDPAGPVASFLAAPEICEFVEVDPDFDEWGRSRDPFQDPEDFLEI